MDFEPRITTENPSESPFAVYICMEDLLDKLKLLNYESKFRSKLKIKPLHRYYFAVNKNPGEQFYMFFMLAAWLIRELGENFAQPEENDDPNEIISRIIDLLKENNIQVDFSPNKLKQGVGRHVIFVLDQLCTAVLKKNGFTWGTPKLQEEKEDEVEVIDDESEINLDRVEEEMNAAYSDDSDEENIFHIDDLSLTRQNRYRNKQMEIGQKSDEEINIDEETWKLEVERVLPLLKVTIKNDNRDWRGHLEQMKQHQQQIEKTMDTTKTQLDRIHKGISVALEQISARERYLNKELEDPLQEFRKLQAKLQFEKDEFNKVNSGVAERMRVLDNLQRHLADLQQTMQDKGTSMTDTTPLVNIKKAAAKIKSEIIEMDIRIGVLECILLQHSIVNEKLMQNEYSTLISVF